MLLPRIFSLPIAYVLNPEVYQKLYDIYLSMAEKALQAKNMIEMLDNKIEEQHLRFKKLVDAFEENADVKYIPNTKALFDKLNALLELKADQEFSLWLSEKCATTVPKYNIMYMFVANNCVNLFDNTQMFFLNYSLEARAMLIELLNLEDVKKEIKDLSDLFASIKENNVFAEGMNMDELLNLTMSLNIDMAGLQNFVE